VGWYDVFSLTYDRQLEALYAPHRAAAVAALHGQPGDVVLDVACGTGQSFAGIVEAIGPTGRVVGIDRSAGMLARARRRAESAGWGNVHLIHAPAGDVATADLGVQHVDRLLLALALTAIDDWRAVLARALSRVRPGGSCVILDVHAERRTMQARMVEVVARADLRRRAWEPLEAACPDFQRIDTAAPARTFGGALYIASGTMPVDTAP